MNLELSSRWSGRHLVVSVAGEIDIVTAGAFENGLTEALMRCRENDGERVIADLRGVTFMDARGLTALLRADRKARDEHLGPLRLVGIPRRVATILKVTGLDRRFPIHSPAEAGTAGVGCSAGPNGAPRR